MPADPVASCRRLLDHMLRDDDTATIAREVVTDPPDDDPMSIEVAASAAVISRALFGWLQTKVDIRVSRKDGKNEFSFYGEERGIAGEATFHDAAGIATRCPGAGVMDELRQAAFGLLDEAGDQRHRGEIVAEPESAALGEGGQGVVDEVVGVVTASWAWIGAGTRGATCGASNRSPTTGWAGRSTRSSARSRTGRESESTS